MDGKFGCCYKLGSCTQIDNGMNIIILYLLEIAGIIENRERREKEVNDGIDYSLQYAGFLLFTYDLFYLFSLSIILHPIIST